MGMPGGPTVLPFKAEKLSFSLGYKDDTAPNASVELACVCFDREGQVLDYIQFNRKAALNSSLKHSSCSYLPPHDAVPADEAIHMYPFDLSPQCEVLLLLASAPRSPLQRNDLGLSSRLQFKVHARDAGKEQLQMLDVDLSLFVGHPATSGAGPLSNGHQTMVISGVYTTPQGWTLSFDCSTFPEDSWGLLLPQLRAVLQRWPSLSAADNARKQPPQTVICSRKGQDEPVQELANNLFPPAAAAVSADNSRSTVLAEGDVQASSNAAEAQQEADNAVSALVPPAAAATPVDTQKLVIELGWEVFKPKVSEEEEEEPPAVDFSLTVYNLQGEELATINPDSTECEGVLVDEEEPEEQQEEPATAVDAEEDEKSEPTAAAAAAGDGDEEGEEGEYEQVEEEESEEVKADKALAAAEAAAAAAQQAAANQRPLAEKFPLKRKVHLTLPELPPGTRALVLTMSQFGGSGFKNVKSLHARLVLEEEQQQQQRETAADEEAEEGVEDMKPRKKAPKKPARVLVHYRFDSVQGADVNVSQILMLKLYKEYTDSAFAIWQQQQVPDVAALLGGAAAAAAAAPEAADGSSEKAKEVLKDVLARRKQIEKELAELRAKNEEEGIEEDEEGEPDLRLAKGVWRVRVLGIAAGGDGPEALTDITNNLLPYDGALDAAGLRHCNAAKVAFPNRDTYFGGYDADAKSGLGLYIFANGGAFVGQYQAGKRQGQGLMILPDGGLYRGGFAADRFEGQGTYLYPDNSYYTGSWKAGKKHGQGTYWDTAGGCLRGNWAAGALKGQGQYDQPNYHFEGTFAKGVPAGPCTFTMSAFRAIDLPQAAASYIIDPYGPTLCGEGRYAVPAGAADEPEPMGDENEPVEADPDKPGMPEYPKYEGLTYESGSSLPCSKPDVPFPPPAAAVAAI